MQKARKERGFSLLELLLVVAIGMVLMGFTIPMFQTAIRSYTLNSAASNMARMVQLARYKAIQQGEDACTRFDGTLFGVDADCNDTLDSTEQAIAVPVGVTLNNTGPGSTTGMNFTTAPVAVANPFKIIFNSRGSMSATTVAQRRASRRSGRGARRTATVTIAAGVVYLTGWGRFTAVTVSGAGRARSWQYDSSTWR